jgi:hypothetical protein
VNSGKAAATRGYFHWLEVADVDSNGTYYTGEGVETGSLGSIVNGEPTSNATYNGKRVQRFVAHP